MNQNCNSLGIGMGPRLRETRATAFSPSPEERAATRGIVSHDWKAEQRRRGGEVAVSSEVVIVVQREGGVARKEDLS